MSKHPPEPEWLPKAEAAALLGVRPRQLERREAQGYIETKREPRKPNESTAPVFYRRADLLALKAGTPNVHARPDGVAPEARGLVHAEPEKAGPTPKTSTAIARRPDAPISNDIFHGLAAQLAGLATFAAQFPAPAAPKPWLTLAEAAEFSGLPPHFLVDRARSGAIRAVNVGTGKREFWRFHREGLAK